MKSNNKPDSLVAACLGMAATFLTVVVLSGCGGGAGSGGYAPPPPLPPNNDIADGSVSGITYTITSFKTGLGSFVAIDNNGANAGHSNATVTLDTATHGSEGSVSANLTITSMPTGANPWIGITSKNNGGLADWSPYRYLRFSVTTGAAGYNGEAAIKTGSGYTWCDAKSPTSIAANSTGTVTLDLTSCSGASLVDVKEFLIYSNTTGTFYIDNVRLEKDTTVTAPDIADGKTNGNIFTITSFKTGLGGFRALNNNDKTTTGGSAVLDTVVAHATEGTNSAAVTVNNIPAGATSVGLALDSNGGLANWTAYRYLKVDITTGATPFNGAVVLYSNAWTYCASTWTWINAGTASTTLVLDLTTCAGANLADVNRIHILNDQLGAFNIDNVRLEKGAAPPPVAPDAADGATSTSATEGNIFTITSFKTGLGGFRALNNNDKTTTGGSAVLDTAVANATEGTNSAAVTVSNIPAGASTVGLALDGNGGLSDWTAYRYLKADITTGATPFNGQVVFFSNAWTYCESTWKWINAGTASTTLVLDLTTCAGANLADVNRIHFLSDQLGTFNIDNIRLTTK